MVDSMPSNIAVVTARNMVTDCSYPNLIILDMRSIPSKNSWWSTSSKSESATD